MRSVRSAFKPLALLIGLVFPVVACDDGTGPEGVGSVAVKFGAGRGGAGAGVVPGASYAVAGGAADELVVSGTNGTLVITDLRIIVDELELEPAEVADCDVEPEPPGCKDFEGGPFFVDVPLSGGPLAVAQDVVPEGMYKELEFEVDDVEVDGGEDGRRVQELLVKVRAEFPDWPAKASMLVAGRFAPADGGELRTFRAYFEAEVEVELDFQPPLVVGEGMRSVVIDLMPDLWFRRPDGTVLDLSQFDFTTTGRLIEFDLELEDGFKLEIER